MSRISVSLGKKLLSILARISPLTATYALYVNRTHGFPNLRRPRDFNERMTYLKLHDYSHNQLVTNLSDKFLVREYVKTKGHEETLNELYGVYDSFDEIDFDTLPDQFALKCADDQT